MPIYIITNVPATGVGAMVNADRLTQARGLIDSDDDYAPVELLAELLGIMGFTDTEIRLYRLLLEEQRTVAAIEAEMDVSERTVRKYLKRLHEKGFLQREVLTEDRLKYAYEAVPPQQAWERIKSDITSLIDAMDQLFTDLPTRFSEAE